MSSQSSDTYYVQVSPEALRNGQLTGVLFQVRDEYLQAHKLVIGDPVTRLLRFAGIKRSPDLRTVGASLANQLTALDEATLLMRLVLSGATLTRYTQYFKSLRRAIQALHSLLQEASTSNRLSHASPVAMKEYRSAAAEFGGAIDRFADQHLQESRSGSSPSSPE